MASTQAEPTAPLAPVPVVIEIKVRLQAIAIPEADGTYSIVVPALPGCVSQADNLDEVQAQITDAAEGWLEVAHERAKNGSCLPVQ